MQSQQRALSREMTWSDLHLKGNNLAAVWIDYREENGRRKESSWEAISNKPGEK